MPVDIRDALDTDLPAILDVVGAAFGDEGARVAALTRALRSRPDARAGAVAVDGSRVVGYVHLSVSWVDAPASLVEVLTLSPLAVAPAHQARGVGGQLLAAAIDRGKRLGAPMIFLEGDPGYYAPRGWRPAAQFGFDRPSTRIPAAAFQVVTLGVYDAATVRGRVVYNDTFWTHDCVGLR